ncbi:MAG: hypothetical protein QOG64_311 [Acidimicrobiaceae bacterium]|nr:hypothetical protein [Acidimicrobiaceae bacterium]
MGRRGWSVRALAKGPLAVLVVAGLVGFLVVAQLGSSQRFSQRLQAESEGDLTRILADLTTTDADLRDQIGTLKLQLQTLSTSTERDDAARKAAEEQLNDLAVLAGTVAVTGPGVQVTVNDPGGVLKYDLMIDLIEELRDAGAEAIAVNGLRLGATSAFGEDNGAITLDGKPLAGPYHVASIGQPATLDGGLSIPGGALDTLRTQRDVSAEVQRVAKVDLPALAVPPSFKVATPVGSSP